MILIIGSVLTLSGALLAFIFGMVYLIRPQFMYYHRMAIQKEWHELSREMQILILVLMRAVSGGFLSVAVSTVILQVAFIRHHQHWIAFTILVMGAISTLGTTYAVLMVRAKTPGRPPVLTVLLFFILILTGFLLNITG